ncbi:MAG: hypothetical protein CL551_14430 [Alcanivorax sp.]|nr:hypothetical protein [Alcanivorax sp.]
MLISQLARSVGVDPQTIRFYERQGDLPPIKWTRFVSRCHSLVFCRRHIPNARV